VAERPRMIFTGAVLDAPDARSLADFYRRLFGWKVVADEPGWVKLAAPEGGPALAFQTELNYARPTWPAGPDDQQMMIHLDIEVEDLEVASAFAVAQGAMVADYQPQDDVRVHLDPAGHPFCLWIRT